MPAPGAVRWITDFEIAERLLLHKGFREVTFKGLVPLLGPVIVTTEGDEHRRRRALQGRLFAASLLKTGEREVVGPLIEAVLAGYSGEGCLVEISYRVMTRLAGRLIGLDELESDEQTGLAVHLLGALVSGTRHRTATDSRRLTRREARDELRQHFIDRAISRRRNLLDLYRAGRIAREDLPSDLITLLLLYTDQAEAGKWPTRQIAGEVAFYAVAAIDTTASLVPHLLHELWNFTSRNPEHTRLLADLTFLRAAAAETLRLHPAIPTIFRQALEPVRLNDELHFAPGDTAGIYVTRANLDQKVFGADAGQFNPRRTVRARTRRAGLSFGGGTHLCLGRELALGTPDTGRPLAAAQDELELAGEAALLAQALFRKGIQPHPTRPVPRLSPFERDAYSTYPVVFEAQPSRF